MKEQTGASHSFTQGITVDNTVPTVSISKIKGDGIVNIPETQAGVKYLEAQMLKLDRK